MNRAERRRQEKLIKKQKEGRTEEATDQKAIDFFQKALICQQNSQLEEAIQLYRKALSANRNFMEAYNNLGNLLRNIGKPEEAKLIFEKALKTDPENSTIKSNLATVLQLQGHVDKAIHLLKEVIGNDPNHTDALNNLGLLYYSKSRFEEAKEVFEKILGRDRDNTDALNNLGTILHYEGNSEKAEKLFKQIIDKIPEHFNARNNLGELYADTDKIDSAINCYKDALKINPKFTRSKRNLGFSYLWKQDLDNALHYLKESAEEQHNNLYQVKKGFLSKTRIKHDYDQLNHLLNKKLIDKKYTKTIEQLAQLKDSNEDPVTVPEEVEDLCQKIIFLPEEKNIGRIINPDLDVNKIQKDFRKHEPAEYVVIDNLLTKEAMLEIRRFCNESTIWKTEYGPGYLGAFMGEGFASKFIMRFSEELKTTFKGIFGDRLLQQAWAFKCDNSQSGVKIHADFAAVNVNFWLSPESANLDTKTGGLIVWDKPSPPDWHFQDYNTNEEKIRSYLQDQKASFIRVPFKENRVLIFNSTLFHETDQMKFKEGYENRRTNMTLLYGRDLRKN